MSPGRAIVITMAKLMLLRHAKSDWDAAYDRDRDRPLNRRGVRSAQAIGGFAAAHGLIPDLVLTSNAVRAANTVRLAAAAGQWESEIREVPELYGAGPEEILAMVRGEEAERMLVVGHNPSMSLAASRFTGGALGMPTAALACLDLPVSSLAEAAWGIAELEMYATPRPLLAAADRAGR